MRPAFEEALQDLLGAYKDVPIEELITALELARYALEESLDETIGEE